jgi:deoxyribonuclease V
MMACLDVAYENTSACAAGIIFREWADATPLHEKVISVQKVQPYQPGQFFRRELPCLLATLQALPPVEVVVVDGYVWLGGGSQPGLGGYLYQSLGGTVVVVGVAKTKFRAAGWACEVIRGRSSRPLFITTAGMNREAAAEHIRSMHGPYRIPTLIRYVDQLCRIHSNTPLCG